MKRPFGGLRHKPPNDAYDAVIIGAGIGGLICANLLAREGLSVLLTEQHYMVGGYCSTFRRKGYTFDAATHFYPLLGNPATITGKLLLDLGITNGWVKMDPVDHFHFLDGSNFAVPADFDIYLARLKREFPEEASALDRFFEVVREVYMFGLLSYFRWRDTDRLARFRQMTVREALDQHFQNEKLKLLLAADCGGARRPYSDGLNRARDTREKQDRDRRRGEDGASKRALRKKSERWRRGLECRLAVDARKIAGANAS